jgi:hypothetical protein
VTLPEVPELDEPTRGGGGLLPSRASVTEDGVIAAEGPRPPVLIFLHHLKTGGTTLRGIIGRQYPPEAIHSTAGRASTAAELKGLRRLDADVVRVVQGHLPFGVHAFLPRPGRYVTLLRNPVERIASLYHHVLEEPDREIHAQSRGHLGSLEEFVESGVLLEVDNGQTRRLSGENPRYGECTTEMLHAAQRHLRERFLAVGTTERFDESLVLFRRLFGWRGVFYPKRQKRTGRLHGDLAPERVRLIERYNRFDLELHAYAAGLLDEALRSAGSDFADEVATLRRVNEALVRHAAARREMRSDPVYTLAEKDAPTGLSSALLDAYIACVQHDRSLQWENARLRRSLSKLEKRMRRELPEN